MRRSTLIAAAGAVIATAGGVWYELARRGTAREVRLNGMSAALTIIGVGAVMVVGGVIATAIGRRRARRYEEEPVVMWPSPWPTVVVRDHRRQPPRMRSVPPPNV